MINFPDTENYFCLDRENKKYHGIHPVDVFYVRVWDERTPRFFSIFVSSFCGEKRFKIGLNRSIHHCLITGGWVKQSDLTFYQKEGYTCCSDCMAYLHINPKRVKEEIAKKVNSFRESIEEGLFDE